MSNIIKRLEQLHESVEDLTDKSQRYYEMLGDIPNELSNLSEEIETALSNSNITQQKLDDFISQFYSLESDLSKALLLNGIMDFKGRTAQADAISSLGKDIISSSVIISRALSRPSPEIIVNLVEYCMRISVILAVAEHEIDRIKITPNILIEELEHRVAENSTMPLDRNFFARITDQLLKDELLLIIDDDKDGAKYLRINRDSHHLKDEFPLLDYEGNYLRELIDRCKNILISRAKIVGKMGF